MINSAHHSHISVCLTPIVPPMAMFDWVRSFMVARTWQANSSIWAVMGLMLLAQACLSTRANGALQLPLASRLESNYLGWAQACVAHYNSLTVCKNTYVQGSIRLLLEAVKEPSTIFFCSRIPVVINTLELDGNATESLFTHKDLIWCYAESKSWNVNQTSNYKGTWQCE